MSHSRLLLNLSLYRHEHLYRKIENSVIRSDSFDKDKTTNERKLNGSRVILCTMSMFCHWRLVPGGFTSLVPVEMVIVDEASQIEVGDYLPLLHKFGSTLRKIAFIGDDKQRAFIFFLPLATSF